VHRGGAEIELHVLRASPAYTLVCVGGGQVEIKGERYIYMASGSTSSLNSPNGEKRGKDVFISYGREEGVKVSMINFAT